MLVTQAKGDNFFQQFIVTLLNSIWRGEPFRRECSGTYFHGLYHVLFLGGNKHWDQRVNEEAARVLKSCLEPKTVPSQVLQIGLEKLGICPPNDGPEQKRQGQLTKALQQFILQLVPPLTQAQVRSVRRVHVAAMHFFFLLRVFTHSKRFSNALMDCFGSSADFGTGCTFIDRPRVLFSDR